VAPDGFLVRGGYAENVRVTFAGGNMVIQILGLLFIGLVIGALARLIKPGKQRLSMVMTLLLGVCGALIGGVLASLIGTGNIFELDFLGFVFAVIAAVLLVGVAEGASGKKA
jgi:uncharacterized membrane protein YeaQ/YmgE (transglycosylase-associated protein family)